jgi:hypothetical protein
MRFALAGFLQISGISSTKARTENDERYREKAGAARPMKPCISFSCSA